MSSVGASDAMIAVAAIRQRRIRGHSMICTMRLVPGSTTSMRSFTTV